VTGLWWTCADVSPAVFKTACGLRKTKVGGGRYNRRSHGSAPGFQLSTGGSRVLNMYGDVYTRGDVSESADKTTVSKPTVAGQDLGKGSSTIDDQRLARDIRRRVAN
jgi:hypothetical protein